MVTPRQLREEARICRVIAREITDPAGIAMLRDRADELDRQAAAIERCQGPGKSAEDIAPNIAAGIVRV